MASISFRVISARTRFSQGSKKDWPGARWGELVDIDDVGFAVAYLATPYARRITGDTIYVDGGVNIMA